MFGDPEIKLEEMEFSGLRKKIMMKQADKIIMEFS